MDIPHFEFIFSLKKILKSNLNPNFTVVATPKLISDEIWAPQWIENLVAIFNAKKTVALVEPFLTYLCANYIYLVVPFFN